MFEFIRNYVKLGLKIIFIILKCAHNITERFNQHCFVRISQCSCEPYNIEEIHLVLG